MGRTWKTPHSSGLKGLWRDVRQQCYPLHHYAAIDILFHFWVLLFAFIREETQTTLINDFLAGSAPELFRNVHSISRPPRTYPTDFTWANKVLQRCLNWQWGFPTGKLWDQCWQSHNKGSLETQHTSISKQALNKCTPSLPVPLVSTGQIHCRFVHCTFQNHATLCLQYEPEHPMFC